MVVDGVDLLQGRRAPQPAPAKLHGTKTDQNWAPTPPARSRGRSVCNCGCGCAMSTAVEVVVDLAHRPRQIVVPVHHQLPRHGAILPLAAAETCAMVAGA